MAPFFFQLAPFWQLLYVVASTGRIESSKPSSMLPTRSAVATAEPFLTFDGKRHCGVGGRSGGRHPGAAGAPGVMVMSEFKFAPYFPVFSY